MATTSVSGVNYSFDGDTIEFFGSRGTQFGPARWVVDGIATGPDSIMPRVRGCIQDDIDSGNSDKIAQLQVGPRQAVVFFLEGAMTRKQLARAGEGPGFVDIPDVPVDGRTLTVRVLAEPDYDVATADSNGNVLS